MKLGEREGNDGLFHAIGAREFDKSMFSIQESYDNSESSDRQIGLGEWFQEFHYIHQSWRYYHIGSA